MASTYANGDASPIQSSHQQTFHEELEAFRRSDKARDQLLQRLLDDNTRLQREAQEARDDYNNERMSRRQWQAQADAARSELSQLRSTTGNDPFSLALIDGDGCIFQDALLRSAGDGGGEAAHLLNNEIKQLLHDRGGSTAGRSTVVVFIYANFDDLARKLAAVGMIGTAGDFGAFARAFSYNQPLFSFIDVGRGKERADHKIKEMFRLFVNNTHCQQIIFGGCHDNGYLLSLEPLRRDTAVAKRITLLETTDAEWQYRNLNLPIVRFESVFRSKPLPEGRGNYTTSGASTFPTTLTGQHGSVSSPAATPSTNPMHSILPSLKATTPPIQDGAPLPTPPATNGPPKTPVVAKSPIPAPSATSSYAAVGGQSESKTISIAPAKEPKPRRYAVFNAENERIDIKLPKPTNEAEMRFTMRVNKMGKCCNNFHLKGNCRSGHSCVYSHEPVLPKEMRLVLAHKARTSPCPRNIRCTDVLCYLGHQCPHEGCTRRDCFFADLHNLDSVPALKVFEDDEVEIVERST